MIGWQEEAGSKTYEIACWCFRDGDEPSLFNRTLLKETIDRLDSENIADQKSLHTAYKALKVFLPEGFDTILDWLFYQTSMTSEFAYSLSKSLCDGNASFYDRHLQRCYSALQLELEEEKEDYPFLKYFGYLNGFGLFQLRQQSTLSKLVAPFLSDGIENTRLHSAFQRLKAFSTAGCDNAVKMKSLVNVLLKNSALSKKAREILVDLSRVLSNRSAGRSSEFLRVLQSSDTQQSVDKDLEWIFSVESPCLSLGSFHTVVVLLGAPHAGKSFLGRSLQGAGCPFLDVGQELWKLGLLQKSQSMFTVASRQSRRAISIHLLDEALRTYMQSQVATHPMIITFVKSIEDAYILLDRINIAAENAGVRCHVQALHLIDDCSSTMLHLPNICETTEMKWQANKVGILEVFASQNCLFEFDQTKRVAFERQLSWIYSRKFPSFSLHPLLTSMDDRSTIVNQVKKLLGVERILFMQPASFVQSVQQCRWISFPGSYQVSHKVKGTRY